jgi:Flp pilus assembly protein TadG
MLKRLINDRRGVSAVEFALIAPVMIMLYLGLAEMTMALMADRRAGHVASAVGDLVSQVATTTTGDIADTFAVGEAVMAPFPSGVLTIRVTSVKAGADGVPKVIWSQVHGTTLPVLAPNTTVTLPNGLVAAGESVIMAETRYSYTSPVTQSLPQGMVFSDTYYLRPRRSDEVICSDC